MSMARVSIPRVRLNSGRSIPALGYGTGQDLKGSSRHMLDKVTDRVQSHMHRLLCICQVADSHHAHAATTALCFSCAATSNTVAITVPAYGHLAMVVNWYHTTAVTGTAWFQKEPGARLDQDVIGGVTNGLEAGFNHIDGAEM